MKILDLKVMHGPNVWSNFRQRVIVMKLDLEEMERRPTHRIEGFADRIKSLLPSLYTHRCSVGNKGGFFQRVEQGTWMGHVIEHIALELQTLAGTFVGYGRTRSTDREGVYNVVFAYRVEEAGLFAAKAAVRVAESLIAGTAHDLKAEIAEIKRLTEKHGLKPELEAITSEARELEIPFHFAGDDLLLLGHGVNQARMRGTITSSTAHLAMELTANRELTMSNLRQARIAVPNGCVISGEDDLEKTFSLLSVPFVLKPLKGSHGRRACVTIRNADEAAMDLNNALNAYRHLYAEEFVPGDLYRVFMADHQIEGVIVQKRVHVSGDGRTSLRDLMRSANLVTALMNGLDARFVPAKDQQVWFDGDPEESLVDFTTDTRALLQRASRHAGLPLCCLDLIMTSESASGSQQDARIIAVEARPDMHIFLRPSRGNPQNVFRPVLKMLLSNRNMGRIPLIAVRGNGESPAITNLLAHILVHAGRHAASASREGMTLAGYTISSEDCTGRTNVRGLLFDPSVDTAVIECPNNQILDNGLPFDTSDISIVTGARPEKSKRQSEEQELENKADLVIGRTTPRSGYNILNADNKCDLLEDEFYGTTVLYSMDPGSKVISRHCRNGGLAAVVENESIIMLEGEWRTPLVRPGSIHRTDSEFFRAALPAALAAWLMGVQPALITEAMATFRPRTSVQHSIQSRAAVVS